MTGMNGHFKVFEQFRADGVKCIFGNPGTSEEGLLDALRHFPDIQYVLGLQESVAVGMADGYARATGRVAVCQLHTGVGLGNGIGMLYQAMRGHSPLLVFAGEAGVKYEAFDAQMAVDLVAMAKPVTKYATRVTDPASVLRVLRRCLKMAATPPMGPVFIALPQDVLDQPNDEPVLPTVVPSMKVAPEPAEIAAAAGMLAAAERPLILMGDGISRAGAQEELADLAEAVGAEVWGVNSSEVNLPYTHPLFCGVTGHMFGSASQEIVKEADVVLICGTYVFPEVFPLLTSPFRPDARVIHIEPDPYEIAKNHPVTMAFIADPARSLRLLADKVTDTATDAQKQAAARRAEEIGRRNRQSTEDAKAADQQAIASSEQSTMAGFAMELARRVPDDVVLFDEALTAGPELLRYLPPTRPGHFFQTRGGSLGVGWPGAIGAKLANPDKLVIGVSGDGGSMYTIQALWTAVERGLDIKFVVITNGGYKLLKLNIQAYWRDLNIQPHPFPQPFDIGPPLLDFVAIAKSYGIPGERVERQDQIAEAVGRMLAANGPYLIDLVVPEEVPGEVVIPPAVGM